MEIKKNQSTEIYGHIDDMLEGQIYDIESFSVNYSFWPKIIEKCKNSKSYDDLLQWKAKDSNEVADVAALEKFKIDFIKAYNLGKSVKTLEEITNKYDEIINVTKSQFWNYIQEAITNGNEKYLKLVEEKESFKKDMKKIFDIGLQNSDYKQKEKNLEEELEKAKKKVKIKYIKEPFSLKKTFFKGMLLVGGIVALFFGANEYAKHEFENQYLPIIRKEVESAIKDYEKKNQPFTEEELKNIVIKVVKDKEVAKELGKNLAEEFKKELFKKK